MWRKSGAMTEHLLTLRYEGRLAARHEMDAADIHHVYEGAKRLLSLHGYVYTEGRVPRNKLTETPFFNVRAKAPREGSVLLDIAINVAGSAVWDATKYTFARYFMPALQAWLRNQTVYIPPIERIEPTFGSNDRGNAPLVDLDLERRVLEREIYAGNAQAFGQITRPIGLHADYVEVIFDREVFGVVRRRMREHEITEAVRALRGDLGDGRQPFRT